MVRELILTGKFKKSLKLAKKRGLNISALDEVVTMLQNDISLDMRYCDHELKGRFAGFRECHIQPDWLLIYLKEDLLVLLIPALICWLIGVIVGLVFKYKAYAYKIEVIFRTGIAPIALGDVYSGENSTAVKFIKRFLALGLYAMAFVVVVNIGASMIGADFLEGLTSGDTWKILGGILNCFVVPFAELGALGVAKQACNEVLGV